MCEVQCDSGFTADGPQISRCNIDGNWNNLSKCRGNQLYYACNACLYGGSSKNHLLPIRDKTINNAGFFFGTYIFYIDT